MIKRKMTAAERITPVHTIVCLCVQEVTTDLAFTCVLCSLFSSSLSLFRPREEREKDRHSPDGCIFMCKYNTRAEKRERERRLLLRKDSISNPLHTARARAYL